MWNSTEPKLLGFTFHACNRAGRWPSHEIGSERISETSLAIWAIQSTSLDARPKLLQELNPALAASSAAEVLASLNNSLCETQPPFLNVVEVLVMVLNQEDHSLEITAAGDFLPVLRMPDLQVVRLDRSKTGMPLGMIHSTEYSTQIVELAPNISVFWISPYTSQIFNPSCDMYGLHRFHNQLTLAPQGPMLMVESIANDIIEFIGDREQTEDICMICFELDN